jgi:hypothetical protein
VVGARAVWERNPAYRPREDGEASWAAGPKRVGFDRVEWLIMPDPATAAAALQSGEADWWENPPNDLLPALRRGRDVRLKRGRLGIFGTGVFNCLHPPFDKPAVRRAVLPRHVAGRLHDRRGGGRARILARRHRHLHAGHAARQRRGPGGDHGAPRPGALPP